MIRVILLLALLVSCGGRPLPPPDPDPPPPGPTGPTGPPITAADITVTDEVTSLGVRRLGSAFYYPLGADDPGGEWERLTAELGLDWVGVRVHPSDIRLGRIRRDIERVPLDEPQLTSDGGRWHSRRSMRMIVDDLLARGMVPYLQVLEDHDSLQEVADYTRELAEYALDTWGDKARSIQWAWDNEPWNRSQDLERYLEELRLFVLVLEDVLGPGVSVSAPDKQSDRVQGSPALEAIARDHGARVQLAIHGLYNWDEIGAERIKFFENPQWLMGLAPGVRVVGNEWLLRMEDMDSLEAALSSAAAYHWHAQAGVVASLPFSLSEMLWFNVGHDEDDPGDEHVYGLVRIDNTDFSVDRPTRTYHAIKMMHDALGGGPIVAVKGPEALLLGARRKGGTPALTILNRGPGRSHSVDLGAGWLTVRRLSRHERDLVILETHHEGLLDIDLPADSLTTITLEEGTR